MLFRSKENFATLIRLQTEFIDDCKKDIQDLKDSEDKGIQLYSLPNKEVIQNKHETILMVQLHGRQVESVESKIAGEQVTYSVENDVLTIHLSRLDVWDMLLIQYK